MATDLRLPAESLRTRARIASWSVWDQAVKPSPVHSADVPWHGDAIDADWLTQILRGTVDGAQVIDLKGLGGDDGSSIRRRFLIRWNAEGEAARLPCHLFTKSTPTLQTRLSAGIAAQAEGRFLTRMCKHLPVEAPTGYHSGRCGRTGRSVHVMEDLGVTRQANFCDAFTPISKPQASAMVANLARLHGTFLHPDCTLDASWLGRYEDFHFAAAQSGIRAAHEQAMEIAADVIPADILRRKDQLWGLAERALARHDDARTVIHSDVHPGNWYVTESGRMGLCDWARVCRGHWARDLAYALMSGLESEDRRTWEKELIELYLDRLMFYSGLTIDYERAWLAYRQQAIAALLMWTPTLCPPPMLPDMQPQSVSRIMIQRITQAMSDLAVLDAF